MMSDYSMNSAMTMTGGNGDALGRIDQYEIVRELGGGGFGTVYLAKDTVSGVDVAVKGLPPLVKNNQEELENIRQNFALVSRLHHPNIAAALVLHPANKVSYSDKATSEKLRVFAGDTLMVMEYAPGVTLSQWRKQFPERKVPIDKAVEIIRQLANALDYAHERKIIHRDIKPSNVMIETSADGALTARVLDFGLAAEIRSSMGRVSREVHDTSGTRPYMAPEQWSGERQGAATDQYALAVLFYELVTGKVPFASAFDCGDPIVMLSAVTTRPVKVPNGLPGSVRKALVRALNKVPGKRFDNCWQFVDALRRQPVLPFSVRRMVVTAFLLIVAVGSGSAVWHRYHHQAAETKQKERQRELVAARESNDLVGVQLWEGGPYWAECNVGATKPEEAGYYFWWGDTVGYKRNKKGDGWVSVKDGKPFMFVKENCPTYEKDNDQLKLAGYIDATGNLVAAHDAATAHCGAPWRMPTDLEFSALVNNCDTKWTTRNGVYGRLVTGKGAYSSKSIFLPAAGFGRGSCLNYLGLFGYYWSSASYSDNSYDAWGLGFYSGDFGRYYNYRDNGQSYRPVRGFAK